MKVEVWSDVVCPWCYLGKRRLEHAIDRYDGNGVEVEWHSFQLQPEAPSFGEPGAGRPSAEHLAERGMSPQQIAKSQAQLTELAAAEGLEYRLDRSHSVNTMDAHRLIKSAATSELAGELVERLFRAQLVEGLRIDDPATLDRLAADVGIENAGPARSEAKADAVRADIEQARALGVQGVPFFVFERRFAVGGAQPVELLLRALEQAAASPAST